MARITEDALDEVERSKLRQPTSSGPSRPPISVSPALPIAALVLIVGGAGLLVAPDPLPLAGRLLAIVAVAVGGWLARGRSADPAGADLGRREQALSRREAGLNRVLTAFALRGNDVLTELARHSLDQPERAQPREAGGDDPGERRGRMVAVAGGRDDGESLELDADGADGALP